MIEDNDDDGRLYRVVVNDEGQYSIWPEEMDVPTGWHLEGCVASRTECLSYIDSVWIDMTPLSVRRRHGSERQVQTDE